MISPNLRVLLLGAVGACLAGCSLMPKFGSHEASPPPPPVISKPIRSIAIVSINEPQSEQILTVGSALGVRDTTLNQPRTEYSTTYTKLLAERKALFAPDLVKTLTDTLTASGYQVTYLPTQKTFITPDGKSEDLSQIKTDADAILVIRFTGAGYVSSALELSYQPWVTLNAHLIRNSNKQDVYLKSFSGGYEMIADSVSLPSSSKYRYPYFRDLTTAIDESIRGLKDSIHDIAVYLGNDLFQGAKADPLPTPPVKPAAPKDGAAAADPKTAPPKPPADSKPQ